jgi:hypothetical protein
VLASADDQAAELWRLREENARLRERIDALEGRSAAPAPAPSRSGEPPAAATDVVVTRSVLLHTDHDAATRVTTVSTDLVRFDSDGPLRPKRWLKLSYSHPGRVPEQPIDHVTATFLAGGSDGRFGSVRTVRFDVDGKTVSCQVGGHETKRRGSGSTKARIVNADEQLTIDVPGEALREIARGRAVTLEVGGARMELSQEQMTLFAAVDARIRASR